MVGGSGRDERASPSPQAVPWAGGRSCVFTAHRVVPQVEVPHDVRRDSFSALLDRMQPVVRFGTDMLDGSDGVASVVLSFDDGSADHAWVGRELAGRGIRGLFFLVSGLMGTPGFLTWEQARELVALGHEVGSHAADHLPVRKMSGAELRGQVRVSKARLEDGLQCPIRYFAPPFGYGSAALAEALADAGYHGCRLTRWGLHHPDHGDRWQLPSIPVTEFTVHRGWPEQVLSRGRIPLAMRVTRAGRAVLPEPLRVLARAMLPGPAPGGADKD